MFGLSHDTYLLLDAVVTIIGLIVLITRFKVHPFIALIIAAGFLGLTSGMPVDKIIKAFQDGFGGVLGFVGITTRRVGLCFAAQALELPALRALHEYFQNNRPPQIEAA